MGFGVLYKLAETSPDRICEVKSKDRQILISRMEEDSQAEEAFARVEGMNGVANGV
jgi:hypothetical protein